MWSLVNILKPYSVEEFLKNNWTSKAVFISSEGHKKFNNLFSWEKLTYLLNFHEFDYPDLRLALNGKVLDESENANLIKWCQEGATLIINKVHKLIPEITAFTSEVKYDLGYSAQVNAYCSWPGKQGFSSHYDTHEAFILQVDGSKQWHVFPDTIKYPLSDQKSASFPPPEGEPYLSCTLNPGDVLYIPRGHWHYAVALENPSLHLTLGVHCKTGIDFIEWLVSELSKKEEWRKSLPLRTETAPINSHIDTLIQNLSQSIKTNNIGDEYIRYLDGLDKPLSKYSLPQQVGFNIFTKGTETKFKNAKFQRIGVSELSDGSGYRIIISGKEVSLKGVPSSLIENLFTGEIFTGNDVISWLPDFDWEIDIVPLLTRLVVEGIIFVDTTASSAD
ncbi:MAG TPA: cupin domain-containing protein [Coleofasciculaceae cyanobacterium]|jgi:ribosomal protein L16 Arg81 hydroxylase